MVFSNSIAVPSWAWPPAPTSPTSSWTRERVRASTGGKASDDSFNQLRIADAASKIDGAVLPIERNIDEALYAGDGRGEDPDAAAGAGAP